MTHLHPTTIIDSLSECHQWSTEQLQQAVEHLRSELYNRSDCDYLYDSWHVDDIHWRRPDLTVDQCREVLRLIDQRRSAEFGINWDVIDWYADDCYAAPDNLDELRDEAYPDGL